METTFTFDNHTIRSVDQEDGSSWFIARDICRALEIGHISMAMDRLPKNEKLSAVILHSGQNRKVWLVNEHGLYRLAMESRAKNAQRFKDWVIYEVLPSIRKTGAFTDTKYKPTDSDAQNILSIASAEFYTREKLLLYSDKLVQKAGKEKDVRKVKALHKYAKELQKSAELM